MPIPPLPRASRRFPWLLPVDRVHAAFYAFVLGMACLQLPALDRPERPLLWYGGALVATFLVAWVLRGRSGFRATLPRVGFTLLVAPFSFLMLSTVVPAHAFHGERLLHDIDTAMFFGKNPNVALDSIAWPPLTELLQIVYAFYYAIPFVMVWALVKERKPGATSRGFLTVLLCLYLSYVGYFLVPATGPNINRLGLYPAHFGDSMPGLWFAESLRASTLKAEWIKHDCWPSGHTALALTCLITARREKSRAFRVLLVPVVLLIFSTMYLRYHYVIDVICGLLLACLALWLGPNLHARFYPSDAPEAGA